MSLAKGVTKDQREINLAFQFHSQCMVDSALFPCGKWEDFLEDGGYALILVEP
jgi:hypothetical protein